MPQALAALPAAASAILTKVAKLNTLTDILRANLPQHLAPHCQVANWRSGTLVIAVPNGALGAELRFRQAEILSNLRQEAGLYYLKNCKILVLTPGAPG